MLEQSEVHWPEAAESCGEGFETSSILSLSLTLNLHGDLFAMDHGRWNASGCAF